MTSDLGRALDRQNMVDAGEPLPLAPVRIVHMGVGAFFRAHQAWYTARAEDADQWGIAAFTGRRPDMALALREQDGLYTLVERSEDGDNYEVLGSISEAYPGDDLESFFALVASPETAIITLTITEAGYKLGADGQVNLDDPQLAEDIERVSGKVGTGQDVLTAVPETALVRLASALGERAEIGGGPLAIVPCDNLMENGPKLRRALIGVADQIDEGLGRWISDNVSFVSTSIDRITPRTDDELVEQVRQATGFVDQVPVVTEPFSDWVLSGDFPAGRPAWETAGATLTDNIEPYELRKLWLLNGAHSLLAYMGLLEGHETVAQAMADPECRAAVDAWWGEAKANLPADLGLDDYSDQLTQRFLNPRIAHLLEQIGNDGLAKLRQRIVPVAKLERKAGRSASAAATAIAKWIVATEGDFGFTDSLQVELDPAAASGRPADYVALLNESLAGDQEFMLLVSDQVQQTRQ